MDLGECCHRVPFGAVVAFLLGLLGVAFSSSGCLSVNAAMESAGLEHSFCTWAASCYSAVCIVNACALVAIVTSRNRCGHDLRWKGCLGSCARCVASTFTLCVVGFLACVIFLSQLTLSYIFFIVWIVVSFMMEVCFAGKDAIGAVEQALDALAKANVTAGNIDIVNYCASSKNLGSARILFFVGCLVTVVSEAAMVACIHGEKERLREEQHFHMGDDFDNARPQLGSRRKGLASEYELRSLNGVDDGESSDEDGGSGGKMPWSKLLAGSSS